MICIMINNALAAMIQISSLKSIEDDSVHKGFAKHEKNEFTRDFGDYQKGVITPSFNTEREKLA